MKIIKKKIKVNVYNTNVTVCIADNVLEAAKALKIDMSKYDGCETWGGCYENQNGFRFLLLPQKASVGDVSHECFHATCDILYSRDIKMEGSTEEVFAYLLGYLVDEVFKIFK
jgi:hypothetical protein